MAKRGRPPTSVYDRVAAKMTREADGCWLFGGARRAPVDTGPGVVSSEIRPDGSRTTLYVHRVVWEHHNGPVPEGYVLMHRCGRKNCCAADHLALVEKSKVKQFVPDLKRDSAHSRLRARPATQRDEPTTTTNGTREEP